MTMWLKQSTAVTVKIGPFTDPTTGDAETALTISQADVRLSKGGGNMAQKTESSSCSHDEIGIYDCALDTTDTGTLGRLQLFVHESGALPVWHDFMVVPANVWDSMFGADKLQTHVVEITAGLITATALASGAITADKIASNAITDAKIATGALTETKFSSGGLNAIADAILKRDWTAVTGAASRSVLNALRFLRNKWLVNGGTLTVYEEDDSTTAWTGSVSTDNAADPVTGNDPS